jgi:hypothetical protein
LEPYWIREGERIFHCSGVEGITRSNNLCRR